jgi:hypothetical protein
MALFTSTSIGRPRDDLSTIAIDASGDVEVSTGPACNQRRHHRPAWRRAGGVSQTGSLSGGLPDSTTRL